MAETLLERVLEWEKAKAALDAAKADEAVKRDALIALDFADRATGTNTKALLDGRVVKCVVVFEPKTDADKARACVAKLEAKGEEGRVLAARLFKWTPDVSAGELKKLPKALRTIADRFVELRACRPSIKVETPAPPARP